MIYDLMIIGGGPGGYLAAERAAATGLKVILFEKNALGGVCLNEGCIPTKTLLYSAKMYDHATGGKKYGITAEGVSYEYKKIADRKTKVVRKLVAGIKMKMEAHHVNVVRGEAFITSGNEECITIACNEEKYEAKRLLICTGSEAFVPPIPGAENNGAILTNREILALTEAPASIVIIGGGVSYAGEHLFAPLRHGVCKFLQQPWHTCYRYRDVARDIGRHGQRDCRSPAHNLCKERSKVLYAMQSYTH